MNLKQRKIALAKLQKEAALNKVAEEVVDDVNSANIEDPRQYAHQVFQELLKNLKIDGLDE